MTYEEAVDLAGGLLLPDNSFRVIVPISMVGDVGPCGYMVLVVTDEDNGETTYELITDSPWSVEGVKEEVSGT